MARQLAAETRKESGCLYYHFVAVEEEGEGGAQGGSYRIFRIVEKWASASHLAKHAATGHFTRLVPAMDAVSTTLAFARCLDALPSLPPVPVPVASAAGEGGQADPVFLVIDKHVQPEDEESWYGTPSHTMPPPS